MDLRVAAQEAGRLLIGPQQIQPNRFVRSLLFQVVHGGSADMEARTVGQVHHGGGVERQVDTATLLKLALVTVQDHQYSGPLGVAGTPGQLGCAFGGGPLPLGQGCVVVVAGVGTEFAGQSGYGHRRPVYLHQRLDLQATPFSRDAGVVNQGVLHGS